MVWGRRILVLLAAVLAGWSFAAWRADIRLADALPAEWEGRDVVLRGVVASLPQDFERGVRFFLWGALPLASFGAGLRTLARRDRGALPGGHQGACSASNVVTLSQS